MCFSKVTYKSIGERLLKGAEITQDSCITKNHYNTVDSSQILETWSTPHIQEAAQQAEGCPCQVTHLL